ncbi:MAG: methyltransferase domain-containing protein [Microcoleus sp. PH2017_10_PVI_O_A]|uniref:O-linked N-acetylglucosamine transferase family protein n=1 Tax=unclassified Microcoleus TaxID=2642155 RepID=UPI001DD495C7|nr:MULTISPECIES: methyltransferase domain-containing protein [unclassified Microcoleus]TAE82920.1 MAG: methyltransferase domain-containing protein [Oscillatoriales cyanobacterium]MCC3406143.1 methyltransferase domain-containing protein [Microcoleus sp. PH2017_10_PVI_O_A]MCC3460551.1 methyltransferase domain-containing protein [Microcoleus sp. PH2017_11_PCY_U_A]MCC3479044.1 methyltransferase domain-containing protein [Microcoleus sp. PH2017_12_PCY_D_A]MCC3559941.1 methyltransferase domain-conta
MIKVLKNWQEIGDATLTLQRQGLPTHSDTRKNWDLSLLYETIASENRNSRIVDLGCSPGCTLVFLISLGFTNLYGIDFDLDFKGGRDFPANLYQGDITNTTFESDFFDAAISISVIEHGVDLKDLFNEVNRIIKNDGLLFLTTDYWADKQDVGEINPLGLPWKVFSEADIQELIDIAQDYGFCLNEDINIPGCSEQTIIWQGIEYTFIALIFKKKETVYKNNIEKVEEGVSLVEGSIGLTETESLADRATESLLSTVLLSCENYQINFGKNSALQDLRLIRKKVADCWLNLAESELESSYLGELGEAHRMLLNSGIKNEQLTDTEERFLDEIAAELSRGFDAPKAIPYLLAAMLYKPAAQLPLLYEIPRIPQWLLNNYLTFMFEYPRLFQEVGEADGYYHYAKKWVDYLHQNIFSNQESQLWQDVAVCFYKLANFIPIYFNSQNLKDICKKRAEILEFVLKIGGHQIDWDFPERLPERNKIRLGILAAHFQPQTETFATLPVYKHLNRDLFEIILYTVQAGNHRLERYCGGHADAMVLLPQDLPSQVQTIRDGDLDVILIATNVTAGANSIAWLALHRLARIQIANVCSCITTGMRHVDYYVSGLFSEPENDPQQHYTETLLALDGSAHCYDFATEEQLTATLSVNRENLGIAEDTVVYISGSNFYKITPEVEAVWTKIVASTPNSKLVLYPFNPNWSSNYAVAAFQKRLAASFARYGLSEEQLIILDCVPNRADVLERLKLGDVYLDSYPFAGATSLLDPLTIGLPTVAMGGSTFRSRVGLALLKELQVDELIAENEESYIELAIALGTNRELRQQKSYLIEQRMQSNPKFLDSRTYSAKMGTLFQELFRSQQATSLSNNLKLREVNLIIFPDWSQSEDTLFRELTKAIGALATHPDKSKMTLLVDSSNISDEDANLALSSVAMNLLMQEDLDVSEGPEITLLGLLSEIQREIIISNLHVRIALENENIEAIASLAAQTLPSCELVSLSNKKVVQLRTGAWVMQ